MKPSHSLVTQLATVACAIAVTACAPLSARDAQRAMKPIGQYATEQSFAAPAAQWPSATWWTTYGDPQLGALIDEALAGAPSIAIAQARLERAQASAQITGAATQTQVSANASATEQKQSYNYLTPSGMTPQGW